MEIFRKLMLCRRLGVIFILRLFLHLPEAPHRQRLSLWITHWKYVSKLVVMISYMLHACYAWRPWMNGLNQSRHINLKEETMDNPVINSHSSRVTIKKFAMRPAKEKNIPVWVWPFIYQRSVIKTFLSGIFQHSPNIHRIPSQQKSSTNSRISPPIFPNGFSFLFPSTFLTEDSKIHRFPPLYANPFFPG